MGTQIKLISRAPQHERQFCQICFQIPVDNHAKNVSSGCGSPLPRSSNGTGTALSPADGQVHYKVHPTSFHHLLSLSETHNLHSKARLLESPEHAADIKRLSVMSRDNCHRYIRHFQSACRCLDHKIHRIGIHGNGGRWNTETERDDSVELAL